MDHFLSRRVTIKLFGKLRYLHFEQMVKSLEAKGEGKIIPVERREDLSYSEFFNYYVRKGIPVVFSGKAKDWGCVKRWDLDYIKALHGDDQVPIIDSSDFDKEVEYINLKQLIDQINKGDTKAYFRFYNLLQRHPEHLKEFDLDWIREHRHKSSYFESFQAFIGGKSSVTDIHNSHISNLFIQVHGEKHWVLYPAYQTPFIHPLPTENGIFRNALSKADGTQFKSFEPDFDLFPYYKYLDGYKVELKPGDILYNPPYMWHTVKNLSDNIGVGYRWVNAWHSFQASPIYYFLDLMAYKPTYFKAIRTVKKDANKQFIDRINKLKK